MIGYKGFDEDMKCRGFQYEEGKEYTHDGNVECCNGGFHFCEAPIDVFRYYSPGTSVFHEVEGSGEIDKGDDDTKVSCSKIKIGARIDIIGMVKAQIEYVKSKTTNEHTDPKQATAGYRGAATAGYSGAATAGYSGAATAGYRGAATAGDRGAATAGDSGAATAGDGGAATAGDRGAATAGDGGAATAGDGGAATAGDGGAATAGDGGAATAGYRGAATSRGSVTIGKNGVGTVRGDNVKIRGGIGAMLTIAIEEDCSYDIKEWKSFVVDGEKIKANVFYTLINGKIVEYKEE